MNILKPNRTMVLPTQVGDFGISLNEATVLSMAEKNHEEKRRSECQLKKSFWIFSWQKAENWKCDTTFRSCKKFLSTPGKNQNIQNFLFWKTKKEVTPEREKQE